MSCMGKETLSQFMHLHTAYLSSGLCIATSPQIHAIGPNGQSIVYGSVLSFTTPKALGTEIQHPIPHSRHLSVSINDNSS